ncbi:MAG TPA: tRNA (guanosine(37)-N1)-methyltransferase TrmD [Anaerolineae bacterium]|nr:tRNA (guanosine(37)-N1)-methyltransferase TrmD [Anaerolineae bacterium]HIQ05642.1 tRNA (guanosine(37)-N1)-methyltransferase TrmD [Anaerolineae bacterium]
MHFDILTLFPGMFAGVFEDSIIKRARERGLITIALHNIRDYATDKHHMTDDTPYGGGGGMIMKPEPIFNAVEAVLARPPRPLMDLHAGQGYVCASAAEMGGISSMADAIETEIPTAAASETPEVSIILLSPQGRLFTQAVARELARYDRLILICGRYEGVDERVRQHLITDEISIGDYVLSGGEVPAMVIVDAVTRLLPGALGDEEATSKDSYADGLLEHPHYTRPAEYRGWRIPDILRSGHHANIARWRRQQSLRRTLERRPDLLAHANLTDEDRAFLATLGWEPNHDPHFIVKKTA